MISAIVGAALIVVALIGVYFATHGYYEFVASGRRRGPDGYPILRDYHAEQCPCDRCIWVMRGTIDRLERELGISEYEGREEADEPKTITGVTYRIGGIDMTKLIAETVTADKLYRPIIDQR